MPIYEYCCEACGERTEKLQKISEAPLRECPVCGKPALKRLVSAAGFRLKGSGWYETDFKSGKKKNLADNDAGSSGASSDKKTTDKKSPGDKPSSAKKD